jgi:protoporphyrinogen oxidase
MAEPRVAIIGAGVAGLAAAYDLTRARLPVTLLEAGEEVGGLAAGFRAPHWQWSLEKYYHHWFASDSSMLGLIRELGWSDQVLFPRPTTVVYHGGAFHQLDSPGHALRFSLRHLGLVDTLRFGLVGAYLRFSRRWDPLERVTAEAWMRRWAGPRVWEALWRPLLAGKFGEDNLGVVNMAWLWARIHVRTSRLGTFVGGFQTFLDRLAGVVRGQGGEVRLGCPVTAVRSLPGGGFEVLTPTGGDRFDAVLSTSSPAALARMAPELPSSYADGLRGLVSLGAVVLVVALDRQLTHHYWHNLPKDEGFPFLALCEHTNFVSPEHFGGDHIVYCGDYLPPEHELMRMDQEGIERLYLPVLSRFNRDFDLSWVRRTWLFRAPYAQPVPPVDHARTIPALRTPLSGLYLASMSQVYPWDRGTNFAVEIGRRVARLMLTDFG